MDTKPPIGLSACGRVEAVVLATHRHDRRPRRAGSCEPGRENPFTARPAPGPLGAALGLLCAFAALLAPPLAEAADRPTGTRVYRVAIDREYEPYEFIDAEGAASGYTPALLRTIGAATGLRFEFVPLTWTAAMAALEAGQVDLVSMIRTPERLGHFEFSTPHSRITQAIFRHQDASDVSDLSSLARQVVGLQRGDLSEEQLRDRTDFERRLVNSKLEGLLLVNAGKLKVFLCAQQAGVRLISTNGLTQVELAMADLFPQDLAFAAHRGNRELIPLLNAQLERLAASGDLAAQRDKWLSGKLAPRGWMDRYGAFLLAAGAGLVLLLVFLLLWNWNLSRAVAERTAALRGSQELLARSQQLAHVGSWELDPATDRLTWSDEVYRLFGLQPQHPEITHELFRSLVHPEDLAALNAAYADSLREGSEAYELEHRLVRKDTGEVRFVHEKCLHVRDASGQVVRSIGMVQDITERKRAEQEKARLEARLQQAQKMESVGRLAGGVAHDFNNMLTAILGNVSIALEQVAPAELLHADLEEIRTAAERAADLTRQLLAFARVQTVAPKVLNLNQTVGGMVKMLQRMIGEDIQLSWKPHAELWPVSVDPSQIDQILANLCVNARDSIADVGKVTIETRNSTLDENACAAHPGALPGEYVQLTVSDDGCGMDRETQDHIFEPFFTTKVMGKGTGLGLATVHGAVQQNEGFISVQSESGQGTIFRIFLPRHVGPPSEAPALAAPTVPTLAAPVAGALETILVVEDEPSILRLTKRTLVARGYAVLGASGPGEALRVASEHPGTLHLLLTDVVMPEMNGRVLADTLLPLRPQMKLLFMSGFTADVIASRGVLDEGVAFLHKPFSTQNLLAKVRSVLDA